MREEHPSQQELTGLPGGPTPGQSAQVVEMSEVAALQAQVLDLGLVRESRPVFVYDSKLAKDKKGNAERQARHRERLEQKGLIMAQVPRELVDLVKTQHGGDWMKLTNVAPLEASLQTSKLASGGVVSDTVLAEIEASGGVEAWVQKRINSAIAALPPVQPVAPKIIEKIVEKQVIKLTAEQKKSLVLGEKVQKMTGWRAAIARKLLGI
jgi:hypothetical protein